MAGYKDSEIEGAVSAFVRGDVKVQRDALGPVDVSAKFDETLQLISSTLIFDPNAIFYLIFLATNKLNASVSTAIDYVDDVLQAIDEMTLRTKDVSKTSLLADAATALLTVDQILTSSDALSQSAFNRYLTAVSKFTAVSLAPNIKSGGEIVRAPQLARSDMLTTLPALSSSWAVILSTLEQIEKELAEFNGLNLPVLSIQSSVRKVRSDLQDLRETFEDQTTTRDAKIAECRDAYLRLTSGKAVLTNYTTVTDPSEPRFLSSSVIIGRAALPAGSTGLFTGAVVEGTKSSPWAIVSGNNELKIAEDGNAETTYTIVPPTQPSVRGYASDADETEFFEIVVGENDRLEIDGLSPVISLTTGVGRTAAQIVSDINTWITANYAGLYSASVLTEGGKTYVKITKTQTGIQRLRLTADDATDAARIKRGWATLGMYVGQADSNIGVSAAEVAEQLNAAGNVLAEVVATLFESGETGEVINSTQFEVPINSIASLLHQDDMLVINSAENAGEHRIVSIVRNVTTDLVTVAASTPFDQAYPGQSWRIVREVLRISSLAGDLTSKLVVGAGNANTTMGFTAGTTKGTTTGFRVAVSGSDEDFTRQDVVVGDVVRISTSPGVEADHVILELSDSNRQLELSPPVAVDLNATVYPSLWFKIFSAAAIAYEEFSIELAAWKVLLEMSKFSQNILELERVMNPLLANKQPSASQIGDAKAAAQDLRDLLTSSSPLGLTEILMGFVVRAVPRMDAALKMLKERSLDRAYDLLMDGQIADFFSMDKDDASSSAYMLKSMRSIVQSDLRISKLEDDVDEVAHADSVEGTDSDFDFSDADDDANLQILGEVPDYADTDSESAKKRY